MDLAWILVKEVGMMFLLLAAGIFLKRKAIMNEEHARSMSNVLLMVITPALVLQSFQRERAMELLPTMAMMAVLAMVVHLLAIGLANLFVRDPGDGTTAWRVSKLSIVFSNAGYMGFPLIRATVGENGVLYGAVFIGVLNIVRWVWSVPTLTNGKRLSVRQLLTNPTIVCLVAGLVMFLVDFQLEGVPYRFVNYIASMNTPLSMLVVGVFLASVSPKEALRDSRVYQVLFLRNILIPVLVLGVLWALNLPAWLAEGKVLALALLVVASCPSGATSIMMPARYYCDGNHGAKIVTVSTLFSIATLPAIVALANIIL